MKQLWLNGRFMAEVVLSLVEATILTLTRQMKSGDVLDILEHVPCDCCGDPNCDLDLGFLTHVEMVFVRPDGQILRFPVQNDRSEETEALDPHKTHGKLTRPLSMAKTIISDHRAQDRRRPSEALRFIKKTWTRASRREGKKAVFEA